MKINKSLSTALDTEFVSDKTTEIVPVPIDENALEESAENDFKRVRETLHGLIDTGSVAISDMHHIAQHDEQARSFEVLATLIKTVSETAEKLLDSHDKKNKIRGFTPDRRMVDPSMTGINVDKAVFVGTTADLLKQLKSRDDD